MAAEFTSGIGREDLREQMCNFLRLLEQSGVREIMLAEPCIEARCLGADASPASGAGEPKSVGGDHLAGLDGLCGRVSACKMCELHKGRTNTVCGEGDARARLMFIGEGPGADEDMQGRPFVGRAGQLLTRVIEAMGLTRPQVYICNVVKCRPPGNRTPEPDEIAACLPYLEEQVELVRPAVICTLGNVATQTVTGQRRGISEMRGGSYDYRGIKVIPTFHPAACLRNPDCKKLVWEDIKKVMKVLDLPIRGVTRNGPGKNGN